MLELSLEAIDDRLYLFEDLLRLIDVFVKLECLLIQAHKVKRALVLKLIELRFDLLGVGPDVQGLSTLSAGLGS